MQQSTLWSRSFGFVLIANFLVFTNHFMVLSTFPFYVAKLGGSAAVAGVCATLFSLVAVLCRPFVGWLLDNGSRRRIVIFGIIGLGLMPLGYMLFPIVAAVFIFRMMHGAALSLASTGCSTLTSDVVPKARFAEGMGMFGMAVALATAFAPALGLTLMTHLGFQALFIVGTLLMIVGAVFIGFVKAPRLPVEKKPLNIRHLINREALPASATIVMFMITFGTVENFVAKYAADTHLPSGGVYFAVMSVTVLLTRFALRRVADSRGESPFVYTCNASMLAAFLLLAFVPYPAAYILSAVCAGYGFGGIEPALMTMAVRNAPPERRGSANSTFLCAYDIGIGVGGGIAGVLITGLGYSAMFSIVAVANILSVLVYFLWRRSGLANSGDVTGLKRSDPV